MKIYFGIFFLLEILLFCNGKRKFSTACDCGSSKTGRIVRGKETGANEYPFMVSVQSQGRHVCGGTIITAWHIITAAHCTYDESINDLSVVIGAHDLNSGDWYVYFISEIYVHRKYSEKTLANDIGILVTDKRIKFNMAVKPVCLPYEKSHLNGHKIRALGWGHTKSTGYPSDVLKEVDLQVMPYNKCLKAWRSSRILPRKYTTLCTFENRKDTCQGDSGGPLLWLNPSIDRYELVALVSYGDKCAGSLPSINTDVYAYLDWIEMIVEYSKPEGRTCSAS